jgi:uncharacterized protein (TIGR02246 family)
MTTYARPFALLPALVLALVACSEQPRQDTAAQEMEMAMPFDRAAATTATAAINSRFMEAAKAGDAAAVAALYTEDATVLPPEAEMVQGAAAVRELWGAWFAQGGVDLTLSTVSLAGAGNFAYEIGTWSIAAREGGAAEHGKYVVVWKRGADGTWKLHTDIWNSSMPAE